MVAAVCRRWKSSPPAQRPSNLFSLLGDARIESIPRVISGIS